MKRLGVRVLVGLPWLGWGCVLSRPSLVPFHFSEGGRREGKLVSFGRPFLNFPGSLFSLFPRPSSRSRCDKRIIGGNHVRSDDAWDEVTSSSSCTLVSAAPMLLLRPSDACYSHILETHTYAKDGYGKEGGGKAPKVGGGNRGAI